MLGTASIPTAVHREARTSARLGGRRATLGAPASLGPLVVTANANLANDITACHVTNVANATVTATLPSWMQNSPTAFEITRGGAPGCASGCAACR